METQLNVLIAEDEFIVAKNIKQQVLTIKLTTNMFPSFWEDLCCSLYPD